MSVFKCANCGSTLTNDDGSKDYIGEVWCCPICKPKLFPNWKRVEEEKIKLSLRTADWVCLRCGKFGIADYLLHRKDDCDEVT